MRCDLIVKRKAVARRLSAVEMLGLVTLIATDKTGTLTENRIFVKKLDGLDADHALRALALANDAEDTSGAARVEPRDAVESGTPLGTLTIVESIAEGG